MGVLKVTPFQKYTVIIFITRNEIRWQVNRQQVVKYLDLILYNAEKKICFQRHLWLNKNNVQHNKQYVRELYIAMLPKRLKKDQKSNFSFLLFLLILLIYKAYKNGLGRVKIFSVSPSRGMVVIVNWAMSRGGGGGEAGIHRNN